MQLACVGTVLILKIYLVLGLCDPIDPFVTIVLRVCLMASHKWWYFTQVDIMPKSISLSLSQTLSEESRVWLIWIISSSSKVGDFWIKLSYISFIQIFHGNKGSNPLMLKKCFRNYWYGVSGGIFHKGGLTGGGGGLTVPPSFRSYPPIPL
jgi:hypothetical protein